MSMVVVEVSEQDVRESIAVARSHGEKFFEQIVWQVENTAWSVLGYDSWDAMRDAEYGDMGVVAPRADRPELVARLRSRGLTQQQIGDTLGVSDRAVRRDLSNGQSPVEDSPESITNSRGQERPATYTRTETTKVEESTTVDLDTGEVLNDTPIDEEAYPETAHAIAPKRGREKAAPSESKALAIVNDIRLYLGAIAASPEIARLTPIAKQYIIDAAYEMIHQLERN